MSRPAPPLSPGVPRELFQAGRRNLAMAQRFQVHPMFLAYLGEERAGY